MRLTARSWALLDATVDNAMSNNAIDGDPQVVLTGGVIRQAGWDQVPWVDGQWPEMTDVISITLTVVEWLFLVRIVEADEPIYRELGDVESVDLGRTAVEAIRAQLP